MANAIQEICIEDWTTLEGPCPMMSIVQDGDKIIDTGQFITGKIGIEVTKCSNAKLIITGASTFEDQEWLPSGIEIASPNISDLLFEVFYDENAKYKMQKFMRWEVQVTGITGFWAISFKVWAQF